ncbi:flavonoid 3'-monooxygenase CYP75B137-like [Magnolia sinica]|uniref:flavonoid 3'-monooxygenase CYP75B137-like n=1 Tax=Magnolia sinica TaxID=86752 RepID=UPI00265ADBD9|nr:flavonoid 3'-monooxygenase CYP75B137-like [Magnolia sinica]
MVKRSRNGAPPLPPGPRGLPLIGSLPFVEPDLHRYFAKLAMIYGPVMKIQLGSKLCVVLSSPKVAKQVLKDHDAIFANRDVSAAAIALTYGGIDIGFSPYGSDWRMMRKVCSQEMMNSTVLDSYYALRRREVHQTVHYVRTQAGKPVNISDVAFGASLNVVTSMIWGDTLDAEDRRSVGHEFRRVACEAMDLLGKSNVSDLFPIISRFDVQGVVGHMKRVSSWLDRIFDSVIDQRMKMDREEGEGKSKDFLQLVLRLQKEGGTKTPMTMNHIKAMFVDLVVGGTDTTSTTIEWAMAEMMQNPEIMRKAQQELEQVVGMDDMVEESHVPKLRYLDAVIKETLRLHPPVVFLVPRSPSQQCTIGGYTVPKGARVFINTWAIHRNPEAWDNPLEFCPERFYKSTSKWDYNGNDVRFIPFGSGRRICAGIPMAERMLTHVLASLLHSFDWRLAEGTKLDLSDKFGLILKKEIPFVAIPTPRLSNLELYS